MATAYKIGHERESSSETKLHCCKKSEKNPGELTYPEPRNIISARPPAPLPTCE